MSGKEVTANTASVSGIPPWDAQLSADEVKRLSPRDKGQRSLTSITRKIELLESWAKNGAPKELVPSIPWNRTKLRQWADADLGLWPWADPMVDAYDGRNAVLMERYEKAISILKVRATDKGRNLKREIEAKDMIIANLERQNAELLDQVRRLQLKVGQQPIVRR
jgi:hypothetical protein